jgi:hypothetical protein
MQATDRVLLRLHVEAVWGVKLPIEVQQECELVLRSLRPSWKLCAKEGLWHRDLQSLLP